MDLQDDKVLNTRISTALQTYAGPTPQRQAELRQRMLYRASQQPMLPPTYLTRLHQKIVMAIAWLNDAQRLLGVVLMQEDAYQRAAIRRVTYICEFDRRHGIGREYLEPLRFGLLKINVF